MPEASDWVSGNYFIEAMSADMKNNATLVYYYLSEHGWTINAISALLGNMQSESTINPGIWENLQDHNMAGGFGLTQWTPATKYIDWADVSEEHWMNGYTQLDRIQYEADNGLQWFSNYEAPIVDPPISFAEFTVSELPPETLADYFIWYYEHPAEPMQSWRAEQARAWFDYLGGVSPPIIPTPEDRRKGLKVWQMIRYHF